MVKFLFNLRLEKETLEKGSISFLLFLVIPEIFPTS